MPLMATILGVFLEDLMGVFLVNLVILQARQVKATQATTVTAMRRKTLVVNVASKSWKVTKFLTFSKG